MRGNNRSESNCVVREMERASLPRTSPRTDVMTTQVDRTHVHYSRTYTRRPRRRSLLTRCSRSYKQDRVIIRAMRLWPVRAVLRVYRRRLSVSRNAPKVPWGGGGVTYTRRDRIRIAGDS